VALYRWQKYWLRPTLTLDPRRKMKRKNKERSR
jgi:hypothetical protein